MTFRRFKLKFSPFLNVFYFVAKIAPSHLFACAVIIIIILGEMVVHFLANLLISLIVFNTIVCYACVTNQTS